MAALNFPNSPSVNDIHTENGVSFKWNGTIWKKVGASVAPSLTGIPYVGWVIAGAATMMGMVGGSDIGGSMAESISKQC